MNGNNHNKPEDHVAILGAGIGGLATGILLSKYGWRVTVIEKDSPPWSRLGESFDWEMPQFLEQLGFNLEELKQQEILTSKPGVIIWSNGRHNMNVAKLFPPAAYLKFMNRPEATFHGNRYKLDMMLLEKCKQLGTRYISKKIKKVHMENNRVKKIELAGGNSVNAHYYIDASGRAGLITRAASVKYKFYGEKMISLYRRHEHDYDGRGTRLYLLDKGKHVIWFWNIHVGLHTTDIGIVIPSSYYTTFKLKELTTEDIYRKLLKQVSPLADFVDSAGEIGTLHTCGFRNYVADRATGDNWIAVGESAFLIDPISSGGVTAALRAGKSAALIVDEALKLGERSLGVSSRKRYYNRISLQADFVNELTQYLWKFHRLWHFIGLPRFARMLTFPQWHINWLSSTINMRSIPGLLCIIVIRHLLLGTVKVILHTLNFRYRNL